MSFGFVAAIFLVLLGEVVDGLAEVIAPKSFGDDFVLGVEENGVWQGGAHHIGLGDGALKITAVGPDESVKLHGSFPFGPIVVQRDADNLETFRTKLLDRGKSVPD